MAARRSQAWSEHELLARVRAVVDRGGRASGVLVGIGDDAAVVEGPRASNRLVLTTDTMVEGVHFRASWLTPRELGVRAFRAAVSDIAAMGARPRFVLLSLELPPSFGSEDALALVRAVASAAKRSGAALVGGNLSRAPKLSVTTTVTGETVARPFPRSSAKPGDLVFVTGSLGGAAAGWRALRGSASAGRAHASAYRLPPLRVDFAAALAERRLVHAMIDVSDGLLQDLGHVAAASNVGIRLDPESIPIHRAAKKGVRPHFSLELALTGGEDYELAFTAPARSRRAIQSLATRRRVPLSLIGVVEKGHASVADTDGYPFDFVAAGFDHFRSPKAPQAEDRRQARKPR